MFTQTENPFGAIVPIYNSPLRMESSYSNNSSNIWKWIVAFIILSGGFLLFLVWKKKNEEEMILSNKLDDDEEGLNKTKNV